MTYFSVFFVCFVSQELRKKDRISLAADRIAVEHLKRITTLNTEYRKVLKSLELERESRHRLEQELMAIRAERTQLQDSEEMLKSDCSGLQATVASLQQRVAQVCEDRRSLDKLAKFISKHAPPSSSSSGGTINDMKKTAAAHDSPAFSGGRRTSDQMKYDTTPKTGASSGRLPAGRPKSHMTALARSTAFGRLMSSSAAEG